MERRLTVNSRTRMARKVSCQWKSHAFHMSGGSMYCEYITWTGLDQKHPQHYKKHRNGHTWLWKAWDQWSARLYNFIALLFPFPTFRKDPHLKPASFKRWICASDSLVAGCWLFWIFSYDTLSSLHHRPRERSSTCMVKVCLEMLQWPYFALKVMRSLKRSSKLNTTIRGHLKPASFKLWICSSDNFV